MAQDSDSWRAVVNTAMGILVPQKVGNFLTKHSGPTNNLSRRTQLHDISLTTN
jgi:hypothetical protein